MELKKIETERLILRRFKIDDVECFYNNVGNDKNDISMFEEAGISVAVANASDDIKNKADYVTLSNDEDGVAIFLDKLIN